jgi:prepilin-type N-terminal cleavage/methylation domain-containing protein
MNQRATSRRRAFTLTELLIVIAIIAIIMGLTAAGIFLWMSNQQQANTEGSMRTVFRTLQQHWNYVVEEAKKETPSDAIRLYARAGPGGSDPTGERARVLWIKVRLMEAFPQTFSEINNDASVKGDPVFNFLYKDVGFTIGQPAIPPTRRKYLVNYQRLTGGKQAAIDAATESSACLLIALSVSRAGYKIDPDQLGPAVFDSDGDGIKEVVDGWRQPLQFYRFAWGTSQLPGHFGGIQELNPAPASSKGATAADPLDPGGVLAGWTPTIPGSPRNQYEQLFHRIGTVDPTIDPPVRYVIPVLVSNGPDRKLGLPSPRAAVSSGLVAASDGLDNLYSFNLQGK